MAAEPPPPGQPPASAQMLPLHSCVCIPTFLQRVIFALVLRSSNGSWKQISNKACTQRRFILLIINFFQNHGVKSQFTKTKKPWFVFHTRDSSEPQTWIVMKMFVSFKKENRKKTLRGNHLLHSDKDMLHSWFLRSYCWWARLGKRPFGGVWHLVHQVGFPGTREALLLG